MPRLADWVWNPILVKELRAGTRGARFFYAHLTILALFAAALLLTFASFMAVTYARRQTPDRIGQSVFLITQVIHLFVAFLVVPAFPRPRSPPSATGRPSNC